MERMELVEMELHYIFQKVKHLQMAFGPLYSP